MNIFEVLSQTDGPRHVLDIEEIDLPGDLETPVSAFLKLRNHGARFLLESAEDPKSIGRYTFIGIDPLLRLEIGQESTAVSSGTTKLNIPHSEKYTPFDGLKRLLDRFEIKSAGAEIPLLGGIVGFTSFEIVGFFEPRLKPLLPPSDWPMALYYFVDTLLVFDHFTRRMRLMRLRSQGQDLTADSPRVSLRQIAEALAAESIGSNHSSTIPGNGYRSNFSADGFEEMVRQTKDHIVKGDVFQAVVSQCETRKSNAEGFHLYRALRMLNPSPYMYYLNFGDIELIGSSPEALVKLQDRRALIRPIAGTRRRGRSPEDDRRMAEELLASEKERAEHVMLIDLARNDLGRVCRFGSVAVPSKFELEYYSHVMHMTSEVTGVLRDDVNYFDLFRAAFPAGTVSGAPKLRAMEIIAELEGLARGPYAGAVGYFSLSGDLDMCITIRTIVKRGESLFIQAGAGIVSDSIPSEEYLETRNKIAALKEAVKTTEEGRL